ncbi:hypothetical protein V6N13_069649 [Hibiscus sabdariffa]
MTMRGLVGILLIVVIMAFMSYLGDAQSNCNNVDAECYCGPYCQAKKVYSTVDGEYIVICTCNCQSPSPPFQTNPLQAPPAPSPTTKPNPQPQQPPIVNKLNTSIEAPPPATKSNPQPHQTPEVTKPNPSIKAPPPTTKSNPQPQQPLTVTKPNPSIEAPLPATKSNPQPHQPPEVTKPNPSIEAPRAPPKSAVVTSVASTPKPSTEHRQDPKSLNPLNHCDVPIYASNFVKTDKYCWCMMENYDNGSFEKIRRAATSYDFMEVDKNCCDAFWAAYDTCGIIFGRYTFFISRLEQHCSMFN